MLAMNATRLFEKRNRHAANFRKNALQSAERRLRAPAPFRHPGLGLESLDLMGIDIDQDPHAFAKFLELHARS
jgi:hypothetical protein